MKTIILILSLVALFSYGYKGETKIGSQMQTTNTTSCGLTIDHKKNITPFRMRVVDTGFRLRSTFVFELPGSKADSTNGGC